MPRIPAFLVAALAASVVAAQAPPVSPPQRLILYLDADSPRVKVSIAKFDAALERGGIKSRHRLSVRHVVVDIFDRDDAARRIAAALRDGPALVIATSSESAGIAKSLTARVPIVFASQQDPIRLGLVRSLAAPGGNVTGLTLFVPIDMKRLEILREIAPNARRLGIVVDHWWMKETDGAAILRAARDELGFEGRVFEMEKLEDLARIQDGRAREIDAWYVPPTTLPYEHPAATVRAIAALRRPTIFPAAMFTDAGGLVAFQPKYSIDEAIDLLAKISGLVLDGVPPGSIPVERPKAFELVVNVAEARRLGIVLPDGLLKRADRVIGESGAVPR